MQKKFFRVKCDLCGKELEYVDVEIKNQILWKVPAEENEHEYDYIKAWERMSIPVVFSNNQDDGVNCSPYFSYNTLDICPECYERLLSEYPIKGIGMQGNNSYEFK